MPKLPHIQFYTGDWLKEPRLKFVSLAAQGLWINLLCHMNESHVRGVLVNHKGTPYTRSEIAVLLGRNITELGPLFDELENQEVYSIDGDGAIYCRRLVRDEEFRSQKEDNGKKGGRPKSIVHPAPAVNQGANQDLTKIEPNTKPSSDIDSDIGSGYGSSSPTNSDTATGTQEGGAGGNQRPPSPIPIRGGLAAEERFDDFYVPYCAQTGKPVTEKDRLDALECWREMPFSEKLEAVRHIPRYVEDYRPDNPRRYKTPANYLKSRIWTEVSMKPPGAENSRGQPAQQVVYPKTRPTPEQLRRMQEAS